MQLATVGALEVLKHPFFGHIERQIHKSLRRINLRRGSSLDVLTSARRPGGAPMKTAKNRTVQRILCQQVLVYSGFSGIRCIVAHSQPETRCGNFVSGGGKNIATEFGGS